MSPTSPDLAPFGRYMPQGLAAFALRGARRCSTNWFAKRWAFFFRAVGVRALRGQPVDVVTFGARLRLYPQRNVAEKRLAFTPQYFDPAELALLAQRLTGDFVFLDVGSSCGGYALFAAQFGGPRARILAVEPLPEVFERLVYNIRQGEFVNVKALGCALLDADGEVTLFVNTANHGESSTRIVSSEAVIEQIRVPAKTLLTLAREEGYTHIDAIKLDIEGAEDLVLEPFLADAPRPLWPRLILMEYTLLGGSSLEAGLRERGYREILRTHENVAYALEDEEGPK